MLPNPVTTTGQYLTFTMDGETYAIGIPKVREVLQYTSVTKVPQAPRFMRGVLNLRGSVVPVLDLKWRFCGEPTESTVNTSVIILEVELDGECVMLGAMVDAVQEVMEIAPGQVQPPPRLGPGLNTEFMRGMAQRENGFITILDMDRVFSSAELNQINQVGDAVGSKPDGGAQP